ncbi:MAG: YceD family protein [Polyangiales bacterium]
MSAFVLQIQDLDESGKDWNFAIGRDWLASALADTELEPGSQDGRLQVHAQRSGMDVLVQGHITSRLGARCARCLEDVALDIDLAMTALFSPEHTRPDDSQEIDVRLDEVNRDYYGGREIVLDPMVREYLLLEAPMKPLCSEDCEGIAVPEHLRPPAEVFGDAAPDARFAPLLKLKEELTKNEE